MALAFFGDSIAERRKQRMVKNLAKPGNCSHIVKVNLKVEKIEVSGIENFVSLKSLRFFKSFNRSTDFLSLPSPMWLSNDGYIEGKIKQNS